MSYDLLVFNPNCLGASREAFMEWFDAQCEWAEDHDYNDPQVCSPNMKAWFMDMIPHFPPINSPYTPKNVDIEELSSADYCIGKDMISLGFSYGDAEEAHRMMFDLAWKHRLGFFDVSSEKGWIWMPTEAGAYQLAFDELGHTRTTVSPDILEIELLRSLHLLCQRRHPSAYVFIEDRDEESFIQVGWRSGLLLDLPLGSLSETQTKRAREAFAQIGAHEAEKIEAPDHEDPTILRPFEVLRADFGTDVNKAVAALQMIFQQTYQPNDSVLMIYEYDGVSE